MWATEYSDLGEPNIASITSHTVSRFVFKIKHLSIYCDLKSTEPLNQLIDDIGIFTCVADRTDLGEPDVTVVIN